MFQINTLSAGITANCRKRALLFLETWEQIKKPVQELHVYKKQLYWFHPQPFSLDQKDCPAIRKKPDKPLAARLIQEIQTNLAADTVDITPLIQSVVGFDNHTIAPMSRWDFNIPSHPVMDKRMVSRLKSIFQHYAARKKVTSRGLTGGRIDQRRLYRIPVTGKCFKEVERIPSLDWSVSLLMDASGSMRGNKQIHLSPATFPYTDTNQADGRSTAKFYAGIVGEAGCRIDTATLCSSPAVCF